MLILICEVVGLFVQIIAASALAVILITVLHIAIENRDRIRKLEQDWLLFGWGVDDSQEG